MLARGLFHSWGQVDWVGPGLAVGRLLIIDQLLNLDHIVEDALEKPMYTHQ